MVVISCALICEIDYNHGRFLYSNLKDDNILTKSKCLKEEWIVMVVEHFPSHSGKVVIIS